MLVELSLVGCLLRRVKVAKREFCYVLLLSALSVVLFLWRKVVSETFVRKLFFKLHCVLRCVSNFPLERAVDGPMMRCGTLAVCLNTSQVLSRVLYWFH